MINHWWVTRPKRKLTSVPEVLATFADMALDQEWQGHISTQLNMEEALEQAGLKRVGDRRDKGGGGARTYLAWLKSLGLIFEQDKTRLLKLTLAGEDILNGAPPVKVLTHQVLRYQYPSFFSVSRGVNLNSRFKIHPFWFLLKLLRDGRLEGYLTQEEIAKVVIVEAEKETDACYNAVIESILRFRSYGPGCIDEDSYEEKYSSARSGNADGSSIFDKLIDTANTFINWLEYTQLIYRFKGKISVLAERESEVDDIIADHLPFIERPMEEEYFQRKYGVGPYRDKDTRNLTEYKTITQAIIAERRIRNAFIQYSVKTPVFALNDDVIFHICHSSGLDEKTVRSTLISYFPHGAINAFMTNYFEMAFKGREDATEFEKATREIFAKVFRFDAYHVGPIGLTPDVHIISNMDGYQGIIDNKAYSAYSISNDHHNRMVDNYIGNLRNYSQSPLPLAFFTYIAGGFCKSIDSQLDEITAVTGIKGSAVTVRDIVEMVSKHQRNPYSHEQLRRIFSVGRQVMLSDL